MRLYLSSFRLGDHGERLHAMAGRTGTRVALIPNALDGRAGSKAAHQQGAFDPVLYFGQHGFDATIVDLRCYFGPRAGLLETLSRYPIIWAMGGNAFLLRRAMRESGFDDIIHRLMADGVIYAGWSAGACVAGASLRAIGLIDEPSVTAPGYGVSEPIWDGLDLVPLTIIPHYQSDHPEAQAASRAVEWAMQHGVAHLPLRDGEVLLMDGGKTEVLGRTDNSAM